MFRSTCFRRRSSVLHGLLASITWWNICRIICGILSSERGLLSKDSFKRFLSMFTLEHDKKRKQQYHTTSQWSGILRTIVVTRKGNVFHQLMIRLSNGFVQAFALRHSGSNGRVEVGRHVDIFMLVSNENFSELVQQLV